MSSELSFMDLMKEASPVVQFVMLTLVLASIFCWTFIFAKRKEVNAAQRNTDTFEGRFWSGIDLSDLYRKMSAESYPSSGIENIFLAGFKEFSRLRNQPGMELDGQVEGSQRAMRIAMTRELDQLDERLPFLATVGSTSPYIGLFGTVWGIMNSFHALGNVQQATLAMVAPGISEALVATAMGLFAAIPAVIGYNRYSTRIERLASRYEIFVEEFISLLHRQTSNQ